MEKIMLSPSVTRSQSVLADFAKNRIDDPFHKPTGMSGKLYPNGEFTLGYVPPKRKTEKEQRYDDAYDYQTVTVDVPRMVGKRVLYSLEETLNRDIILDHPLGLSTLTNSHNRTKTVRKPRGSKGISGLGKRTIRNGAWILQKSYGKKQLGFLTVTLPSFPERPDILALLAIEWSELTRQFLQEFSREIKRSGNKAVWVGCTEIQEKRLRERGEVAPHLHLVYHAHKGDYRWFITADKIREIWSRVIGNVIEAALLETVEVNTKAAIDTKTVKKDASAYLGKYMSKGGEAVKAMEEGGMSEAIPSAWWHCCTQLKKMIHSLITDVPQDVKRAIHQKVDLVKRKVMLYLMPITINDKTFGYVGKFKRSLCHDRNLLQLLESFY